MRLKSARQGGIVDELNQLFSSTQFHGLLVGEFGLRTGETFADVGLQKYLRGYEISPHPDVRFRAAPFR